MNHSVKELSPSKVELLVSFDESTWKEAQEKAFRKLAAKVSLPGFRPGKAPEAMVRPHVDQNKVINEAIDAVLSPAYATAISEEKLRPFSRPDVEITKISDTELEVKFTFILVPTVTLGKYTELHADKEEVKVTEEEIAKAIDEKLLGAADLVNVERPAQMGDTVTLDFEGFIDGVAFEGGKGENYDLVLGSHSLIPGFEEALVGVKPGEEKDVSVTFPEQYVAELAGKDATFHCLVHEVKEKSVPTLSDEAVKDLGIKDVETVDALKEKTKEELLAKKSDEAQRKYYEAIIAQIVAGSSVVIDESIIADEAARTEESTKKNVEDNGLTFEQYLQITGQDEETLKKSIRESTEANLKTYLVLEEICIKEGLLVDDAELDHEIAKLAERYSMPVENVRKALGNLENYRDNLRQRKLQEFLLSHNN